MAVFSAFRAKKSTNYQIAFGLPLLYNLVNYFFSRTGLYGPGRHDMKLSNIIVNGAPHVAVWAGEKLVDAAAAGFKYSIDEVYGGAGLEELRAIAADAALPAVEAPVWGNVKNHIDKVICVAMNYQQHAINTGWKVPDYPQFFNKYADCVVPCGAFVELPPYEDTYDYEAEIVIVIGKDTWQVPIEEAKDHIFGYTCGNDLSCRGVQKRTPQWMLGKNFPGFAPAGPVVVTADEFDPDEPHSIRSHVNGELRQDGVSTDMIFKAAYLVSYTSKYVHFHPGDMIFTGTPAGVAMEGEKPKWLKPGDVVDIDIEGLGHLRNTMR